jgi:hydroxymethylpyrimidine pyrophosphatase-like HAD family hydrolase
MAMLLDALQLDTPIAGFNGGLFVKPDLTILERKTVPPDIAAAAIKLILDHGLDVWVYRGNDWLVAGTDAPHVAREARTVQFAPTVVKNVAEWLDQIAKIVGVSDDLVMVQRCEADARVAFGQRATANRCSYR